ncbi:P-loop containing nucleoside triphosphate hydrolase protein [Crepidotus variabilis]|uniref:P-loop containing nucleoside triphosphate hydrolase protein n=1 Tax=Crepidotus variabilis TaxID=179855 RepID=A0A9P6EPJ7_9AGAR|nr:P-loop containing nucleoside triphosphate hydrolase protein [Crepidotus variabilis]
MPFFYGVFTPLINLFKKIFKNHNDEQNEQISPEDIVIALVGVTGSGKSTFIKLATGQDTGAVNTDLKPRNARVHAVKMPQTSASRSIWLVDTPGIDTSNDDVSERRVLHSVSKFLNIRCHGAEPRRLDGILNIHNISAEMDGNTSSKAIEFKKLMGDSLKNVILVTTFWDVSHPEEDDEKKRAIEKYWEKIGKDLRQHHFHNTPDSAHDIVQMITPFDDLSNAAR